MEELARCYRVLGLEPGTSLEEVKSAYRDLVNVWHPDRFGHNERLRSKAEEQLKEINRAYEYLMAYAGQENALQRQAESQEPLQATPPGEQEKREVDLEAKASGRGSGFRNIVLVISGFMLLAGGILWWRSRHQTNSIPEAGPAVNGGSVPADTNVARSEEPSKTTAGNASTNITSNHDSTNSGTPSGNILESMVPMNKVEVVKAAEGVTLTSRGDWSYIESPKSARLPLVIRTRAKTELNNIRLYYGVLGRVIFNWELNPAELRVHDPLTGKLTAVSGKGMLTTKEWHDIVWEISTNAMKISVDGDVRFEGKGYYSSLSGFPAIGPADSPVTVSSFAVDSEVPEPTNVLVSRVHPVAGDILDSMVPMENGKVTKGTEGTVITPADQPGPYLKSKETFSPPFVIRTRAKTESRNLRVYCGDGFVILNWEINPLEMRVRDPLNKHDTGVSGKGLILPNTWHDIVWVVTTNSMSFCVDGQVRYQNRSDYRGLNAWAGIGPAWSKVTIDYFAVSKQ
jgi:curved DNA-binding protein CbpA